MSGQRGFIKTALYEIDQTAKVVPYTPFRLCGLLISLEAKKPTEKALEKVPGEISELENRLEKGMFKDE